MIGFTTIMSGITMVFGATITIFIVYILGDMFNIYRELHPSELKKTIYTFIFFLLAATSLLLLNGVSFIIDLLDIYGAELSLFIHELSFVIYNINLALGLGMLILIEYRRPESITLSNIAIGGLSSLVIQLRDIIKILSILNSLEALIIIIILMNKRSISRTLFSTKLWYIALILIISGRITNLLLPIYFSYISIIYFDVFAFTSLLLLSLEAKIRGGQVEI